MDTNKKPDPSLEIIKLGNYIHQQLSTGLHPDEIAAHLREAGWPGEFIQQAFQQVQTQVMPSHPIATNTQVQQVDSMPIDTSSNVINDHVTQQPVLVEAKKRGRTKTGWLLLKQSIKVLKSNKSLIRYIIMSAIIGLGLLILFALVFYFGRNTLLVKSTNFNGSTNYNLAPTGYAVAFVYYVLAFFILNLYSAGLVANLLDIFHGRSGPYEQYMKKARSKSGTLFTFSVIEATVGMILRAIAERSSLLARIIARIIGAIWSLARLFVIPLIVSTDEGAFSSIKSSTLLLKATWGENLIGRVTFGVAAFFIYILMFVLSAALIFLGAALAGGVGATIGIVLVIVMFLTVVIFISTASSVLNTALFYYAQYKQIPAAFDAELLNSVFIKRKKRRGLFRR
jgi:hypothetical protein